MIDPDSPDAVLRWARHTGMRPVRVQENTAGHSGNRVWRVGLHDGSACFVKRAAGKDLPETKREAEVLRWLDGRCGAPRVRVFEERDGIGVLCCDAVPGRSAAEMTPDTDADTLMTLLARALRTVHDLPVGHCPFDRRLATTIGEAHRRAADGDVDLTDLDDVRAGWTEQRLLDALNTGRPSSEDLVVVHGDYCLPNILFSDRGSGMIDWGRSGVADRYLDIALLFRSFGYNSSTERETLFCREYGLPSIDRAKIEFYQLLDEFF